MASLPSIYRALFGKDHPTDGSVIELAEHGRVGGLSTGQGFKFITFPGQTTLIDESSDTVTYIGVNSLGLSASTSAASWQIKKILISGTVTSITFADGNDNFDNVWDNRDSLTYS